MPKGCYSKSVALRSNNRCWYCGLLVFTTEQIKIGIPKYFYFNFAKERLKRSLLMTHDHIIPRSLGGSNKKENLVLACNFCNSNRQSTSVEDFREWVRKGCISKSGNNRMPLKQIQRLWIINDSSVIFYGEQLVRE